MIVFQQIVIGAIIENTPAERDGRLRPGDELISVDKNVVAGKPHKYVIDLMHAAARNGQVSLTVRRRVLTPGEDMFFRLFWWRFCFCFSDRFSHFTGITFQKHNLGRVHADSLCVRSISVHFSPTHLSCGRAYNQPEDEIFSQTLVEVGGWVEL